VKFIGHQKIIEIFNKSIKNGKLSQAYIFSGPEAVGKFTLAIQFALAIISGNKKIDVEQLDEYEKNQIRYTDLMILTPLTEEKKGIIKEKEIKAEAIREKLKDLFLYPYQGKKKVLIINNAHRMNRTAQNILLKSLEEPNDSSIIILVSHRSDLLLSTIKSRCQKINFTLVPESEFVGKNLSTGDIQMSMGRPGILSLPREELDENRENEIVRQLANIGNLSINEKMWLASQMSENIITARKVIEKYIWQMRLKIISLQNSGIKKYSENISLAENCVETISSTNANAKLTIENMLLHLK
jgi:DNA polymerase III delta prime subunit